MLVKALTSLLENTPEISLFLAFTKLTSKNKLSINVFNRPLPCKVKISLCESESISYVLNNGIALPYLCKILNR